MNENDLRALISQYNAYPDQFESADIKQLQLAAMEMGLPFEPQTSATRAVGSFVDQLAFGLVPDSLYGGAITDTEKMAGSAGDIASFLIPFGAMSHAGVSAAKVGAKAVGAFSAGRAAAAKGIAKRGLATAENQAARALVDKKLQATLKTIADNRSKMEKGIKSYLDKTGAFEEIINKATIGMIAGGASGFGDEGGGALGGAARGALMGGLYGYARPMLSGGAAGAAGPVRGTAGKFTRAAAAGAAPPIP
jgi:hypothetical protein